MRHLCPPSSQRETLGSSEGPCLGNLLAKDFDSVCSGLMMSDPSFLQVRLPQATFSEKDSLLAVTRDHAAITANQEWLA